jgi:hypothetical protein
MAVQCGVFLGSVCREACWAVNYVTHTARRSSLEMTRLKHYNLSTLGRALDGESLPHVLGKLLRLTDPERQLFEALAQSEGLSPAEIRFRAPACYSPSLVGVALNRKLAAAGLAVRVTNSCQRGGPGRQVSVWKLVDEPRNDAAA